MAKDLVCPPALERLVLCDGANPALVGALRLCCYDLKLALQLYAESLAPLVAIIGARRHVVPGWTRVLVPCGNRAPEQATGCRHA